MSAPITFNVTGYPEFAQAVYNPMKVSMTKQPYAIGDMFFIEVWAVPDKDVWNINKAKTSATLLQTLTVNGQGTGDADIYIHNLLASSFGQDNYYTPNPSLTIQKDESCYQAYYLKAGYLTFDRTNTQQKVYGFESPVQYVIRASNKGNAGNMNQYCYNYNNEPVKFLTDIPDGVRKRQDENTYLPFFLPLNQRTSYTGATTVFIKADLTFSSGTVEQGYELGNYIIPTGGCYLLNLKPKLLQTHPKYNSLTSYSVYLQCQTDTTSTFTISKEISVDTPIQQPINAQYMNRLGGWDAVQLRRDSESETKNKPSTFTAYLNNRVYEVDTDTTTTYHSSHLTLSEYNWLQGMANSPAVYINNKYAILTPQSFKKDTSLGLTVLDITVTHDNEEDAIKL